MVPVKMGCSLTMFITVFHYGGDMMLYDPGCMNQALKRTIYGPRKDGVLAYDVS